MIDPPKKEQQHSARRVAKEQQSIYIKEKERNVLFFLIPLYLVHVPGKIWYAIDSSTCRRGVATGRATEDRPTDERSAAEAVSSNI